MPNKGMRLCHSFLQDSNSVLKKGVLLTLLIFILSNVKHFKQNMAIFKKYMTLYI